MEQIKMKCPVCGESMRVPMERHPEYHKDDVALMKENGVNFFISSNCHIHNRKRYMRAVWYASDARYLNEMQSAIQHSDYSDFRDFSPGNKTAMPDLQTMETWAHGCLGVSWKNEIYTKAEEAKKLDRILCKWSMSILSRMMQTTYVLPKRTWLEWADDRLDDAVIWLGDFLDDIQDYLLDKFCPTPDIHLYYKPDVKIKVDTYAFDKAMFDFNQEVDRYFFLTSPRNQQNQRKTQRTMSNNIRTLLDTLVEYYDRTRGRGHTKVMLDGARNTPCLVVGANFEHVELLKSNIPGSAPESGHRRWHFAALTAQRSFAEQMMSKALPMVFDNFTLRVLFDAARQALQLADTELASANNRTRDMQMERDAWKVGHVEKCTELAASVEKHNRATVKIEEQVREIQDVRDLAAFRETERDELRMSVKNAIATTTTVDRRNGELKERISELEAEKGRALDNEVGAKQMLQAVTTERNTAQAETRRMRRIIIAHLGASFPINSMYKYDPTTVYPWNVPDDLFPKMSVKISGSSSPSCDVGGEAPFDPLDLRNALAKLDTALKSNPNVTNWRWGRYIFSRPGITFSWDINISLE